MLVLPFSEGVTYLIVKICVLAIVLIVWWATTAAPTANV